MNIIIEIITTFLGSYCLSLFYVYSWNIFEKSETSIFSIKNKIVSIIISIFMTITTLFLNDLKTLKMIINLIVFCFTNYFLISKNIRKSLISLLVSQLINITSELIFIVPMDLILKENFISFADSIIGLLIINIIITIISFLILATKLPTKSYNIMIKATNNFKNSDVITYTFIIFTFAITSTTASYLKWNAIYVLIINMSLITVFIFVSIKFAKAKNEFDEISSKYETSITSLREYEAMIDKYRIYNHENKNELQTLRNLISKKNTKALKYIDEIINDKIKDNEKIMYKTSKIPEGGLRATIYAKLCTMDELGIKYSLDIAKNIRTVDLINMKEDIVLNICKILGVFLDNAIEAVKGLKTKHIGIEIYLMDGDLCVDITNNYEGKLDINKIGSSKYTTKGGTHGYGLSLVNQIISDYPDVFENEKSITKNTFTQKIKIKM